jgi:DNA-binding response OmpR family regulator
MTKAIKNYDFIILDLNMPILNGFDACRRICEVYLSFNNLSDYDDPKAID